MKTSILLFWTLLLWDSAAVQPLVTATTQVNKTKKKKKKKKKPVDPNECKARCQTQLVFDASYPRTATTSFALATKCYGYNNKHLMRISNKAFKELQDFDVSGDKKGLSIDNPMRHLYFGQPKSYGDLPFYALACPLSKLYPKAKFVLRSRDADKWFESYKYIMCMTKRSIIDGVESQIFGKDLLTEVAKQVPTMCRSRNSTLFEKFRPAYTALFNAHTQKVLSCIPKERLLHTTVEESSTKTKELSEFLGCNGTEKWGRSIGASSHLWSKVEGLLQQNETVWKWRAFYGSVRDRLAALKEGSN